jgi:hypothetical protein
VVGTSRESGEVKRHPVEETFESMLADQTVHTKDNCYKAGERVDLSA